MTVQLGFSLDFSRCTGCLACIVACQDQNDLPGGLTFRHVTKLENGKYPAVKFSHLSMACLHCGEAPCIRACPTGALQKRDQDGIVVLKRNLCIGCHLCGWACPFGAPHYLSDGKMEKCDFCVDRVEAGLEPACVRVCPSKALTFGSLEKLGETNAEKASRVILGSRGLLA